MKQKAGVRTLASLPYRKADFVEPMDCAPVTKLPDGPEWIYEIKLDGYRAVGVKSDRGAMLFARRQKSCNHYYPHIVDAPREPPKGTVVDAQLVDLDKAGRPRFALLQKCRPDASLGKLYFT